MTIIKANPSRMISGAMETARRNSKAPRGGDSVLTGPYFVDRTTPKAPDKMETGGGAPSFCWVCSRQLQRAPGKGLGLFYFITVSDRGGHVHRVHGSPCFDDAIKDGCKLVTL